MNLTSTGLMIMRNKQNTFIKMKTVEVVVTYKYELEINEFDGIVKEYETENDLIVDCVSYRFSDVLPVIKNGGVKIIGVDVLEVS